MIKQLSLVAALSLSTMVQADEAALQKQIEMLMKRIEQLEKGQGTIQETQTTLKEEQIAQSDMLSKVNAQSANDNIKWDIDFRSAYHNLGYNYSDNATKRTAATPAAANKYNASYTSDSHKGESYSNPSLLTNRLWLGMGSKVNEDLFFYGQLALNYNWGADTNVAEDKIWQESSRPNDVNVRLRQAYFVYKFGNDWDVPMNISAGRRAAMDGFLANHREMMSDDKAGSPLAHITNMEVDGAMMQFDFDKVIFPGSYLKIVYGRAHDPAGRDLPSPFIDSAAEDNQVDFIVMPISIYNDGQHNLMAQYSMIMNSKGEKPSSDGLTTEIKTASGTTHLAALSYQLDGLSEDNEFLEESTLFASAAMSSTNPDSGYLMLGSTEKKTGYSFWAGFLFPDQITDGGRFGLEYNYGSKYWTPMTWAEDTTIGSKIATRGNAYEGYWNIPIVGKNLTAQLRYTYLDHHYRANTTCYWDNPLEPNLDHSQELRAFVRYQY